jgi:hypothetical protein
VAPLRQLLIDDNSGHVNIVMCCTMCNMIKSASRGRA